MILLVKRSFPYNVGGPSGSGALPPHDIRKFHKLGHFSQKMCSPRLAPSIDICLPPGLNVGQSMFDISGQAQQAQVSVQHNSE